MDENQPNEQEIIANDPEWAAIRKMTPGLKDADEETPAPEDTPEPVDPAPAEDPKGPEETPEAGQDEPEVPAPTADPENQPAPAARPERYIPVAKYTDEKKEWKTSIEEKDSRIAELEAMVGPDQGKKILDDKVKAYAEEHGVSEDSVRELLKLTTQDSPAANQELDAAVQLEIARAREINAQNQYDVEFDSAALPELKKAFPNATDQQISAAKKELEKLACTEGFLDKPLDFIVYKSKAELAPLFDGRRKGPETARQAARPGSADFTAADLKDGKVSFDEMTNLSGEKQAKIVEAMDVPTYDKYLRWVNKNSSMEINRGGKKINF